MHPILGRREYLEQIILMRGSLHDYCLKEDHVNNVLPQEVLAGAAPEELDAAQMHQ